MVVVWFTINNITPGQTGLRLSFMWQFFVFASFNVFNLCFNELSLFAIAFWDTKNILVTIVSNQTCIEGPRKISRGKCINTQKN